MKKNQLQLESQRMESNTKTMSMDAECRMEMMEQYSRRDCLMILGLEEVQGENTTQKVVESAMGTNLSADEISKNH